MGLTNLGIFHTIVGIVAIGAALTSLIKFGKIDLSRLSGKIYFYGTIITSLTALGISKRGGFNAGHAFSLFIIVLVAIAFYLFYKRQASSRSRYFENFLLSFSLLLSLLPTVNETLTRVPIGAPVAKDMSDPVIAKTLLVLLVVFIIGSVLQFIKPRKINARDLK